MRALMHRDFGARDLGPAAMAAAIPPSAFWLAKYVVQVSRCDIERVERLLKTPSCPKIQTHSKTCVAGR